MYKTLLLVFIHGFKGTDETFGTFPPHLQGLVQNALPRINVIFKIYPSYQTRGELKDCVASFREWLENTVIDLEVTNNTPSPTIDPSVHVILVGHSMGGIVAAETLIAIASDKPIDSINVSQTTAKTSAGSTPDDHATPWQPKSRLKSSAPELLFPHIQGILAFDTPFLGLAPEMIAHGLEGGHKLASSAYNTFSEVLGWNRSGSPTSSTPPLTKNQADKLLQSSASEEIDAAAVPTWQSWGKIAMFAGAAGAVAAGSAAALYSQKERISAGWAWAGSHLLFVGDLAKAELLKARLVKINTTCRNYNIGAANLYTNLGRGAREGYGFTEKISGKDRTFCNLPTAVKQGKMTEEQGGIIWQKTINDKAKDETSAHMCMFFPADNPGFFILAEQAKEKITGCISQEWYGSATRDVNNEPEFRVGSLPKDWEEMDGRETEDLSMRDDPVLPQLEHATELQESVIIDKASVEDMKLGNVAG